GDARERVSPPARRPGREGYRDRLIAQRDGSRLGGVRVRSKPAHTLRDETLGHTLFDPACPYSAHAPLLPGIRSEIPRDIRLLCGSCIQPASCTPSDRGACTCERIDILIIGF